MAISTSQLMLLSVITIGVAVVANAAYSIPDELIHCYRGNGTLPGSPQTVQYLLELIRKIERHNPTTLDMRLLSAEMIHRLRIDGIENVPGMAETEWVIPYSPNGIMVPKYTLLRQLVSNVPGRIDFDTFLTPSEICNLHRMLSSSVEPFQREDERRTCPITLMSSDGNPQAPWITQNKAQKSNSNTTTFSRPLSRCPLERGTVHTADYGTIAPGVVIMSIAAGLQPQNVLISEFVTAYRKNPYESLETMETADTRKQLEKLFASLESIDNMYAAGLAGDLAEVCLYQGPALLTGVTVGLAGSWNDSYFPRTRYLAENHAGRWEMTDSEILAGIDGFYLAQQTPQLVKRLRRLRLSQVLDMFYSDRGIPVASIENVSHRRRLSGSHGVGQHPATPNGGWPSAQAALRSELDDDGSSNHGRAHFSAKASGNTHFRNVFADDGAVALEPGQLPSIDVTRACQRKQIVASIERDKLKQETYKLVEVLQYATGSVVVEESLMQRICDATVDSFFQRTSELLDTIPSCPAGADVTKLINKPNVDLTVILDGSRDEYHNLQLVAFLVDIVEVSHYGSSISIVHGTTGEYMVNKTNSMSEVFERLQHFRGSFPAQLSLSRSFASVVATLSRQMDEERSQFTVGSNTPVVLVFSQAHRIAQTDFESARRMLRGSFLQFPDLYFAFVTNDPVSFRQMTDFSDTIHSRTAGEHYHTIDASRTAIESFANDLGKLMRSIPQRLIAPQCHTASNRDSWRSDLIREEYEQYLSPGVELRYRLGQLFLRNSRDVRVQFMNTDYGEFTVCEGRDHQVAPANCQMTGPDQQSLWFNHSHPCGGIDDVACRSIYYVVRMDSSNMMCNENDCRYPDQVRFVIRHEGIRCLNDGSGALGTFRAQFAWMPLVFLAIFHISFK